MLGRAASAFTNGPAAHHRHHRAVRRATCRTSTCRSIRTVSSTTRSRARRLPARSLTLLERGQRRRAADELLRRPGPAEPGHARGRLLQVRPQLHRSGLSERRRLPDRRDRAGQRTTSPGYSQIIPPTVGRRDAAVLGAVVPGAVRTTRSPATAQYCEAQTSEFAPATSVPARSAGTNYYVHLRLDGSQLPGSSQIFNNHIPLDPDARAARSRSRKTTPLLNVTRGQLVPYMITVQQRRRRSR